MSMTTLESGWSSDSVKVRPNAGWTPRSGNKFQVPAAAVDHLRQFTLLAGEVELPPAPCGHVLKAVGLRAPVVVVGGRNKVVVEPIPGLPIAAEMFEDHDEPAGIAERERLEQDRPHDSEERRGGADAQGDDEDRHQGESRGAAQGARAVAQIAGKGFETVPTPGSAGLFAEQCRIAEGAEGRVAGFFWGHAGGDIFGDLVFEVEAEFVVEARGGTSAAEEHQDPHSKLIKPAHGFLPWAIGK